MGTRRFSNGYNISIEIVLSLLAVPSAREMTPEPSSCAVHESYERQHASLIWEHIDTDHEEERPVCMFVPILKTMFLS